MDPDVDNSQNNIEQQLKAFPDPEGSMFDDIEKSKMESTAPIKVSTSKLLTPKKLSEKISAKSNQGGPNWECNRPAENPTFKNTPIQKKEKNDEAPKDLKTIINT